MSGNLTHPVDKIIWQLLQDLGHVTDPADNGSWPCYIGPMPDTPDNCVALRGTEGKDDGRLFTGERAEHPGIQIRVRCDSRVDGYVKAKAIFIALDALTSTAVTVQDDVGTATTTYRVYAFTRTGTVISLGAETPTSRRETWSFNLLVSLREQ